MPTNCSNDVTDVGAGKLEIALTFDGRGRIPSLDTR